jgi:hypothetical protein
MCREIFRVQRTRKDQFVDQMVNVFDPDAFLIRAEPWKRLRHSASDSSVKSAAMPVQRQGSRSASVMRTATPPVRSAPALEALRQSRSTGARRCNVGLALESLMRQRRLVVLPQRSRPPAAAGVQPSPSITSGPRIVSDEPGGRVSIVDPEAGAWSLPAVTERPRGIRCSPTAGALLVALSGVAVAGPGSTIEAAAGRSPADGIRQVDLAR